MPFTGKERLLIDLYSDEIDPIRDLDGNLLDCEWFNEFKVYGSGGDTAGGDHEFRINVLKGDQYATGLVNYTGYYATYLQLRKVRMTLATNHL